MQKKIYFCALFYIIMDTDQADERRCHAFMRIREYRPEDCRSITALFYDTVHTVNAADYTEEQLDAWADGNVDMQAWDRSFRSHTTYVAVEENARGEQIDCTWKSNPITNPGRSHGVPFIDASAAYEYHLYAPAKDRERAERALREAGM